MIQSMTGFGKSTLLLTQKKITFEIKSLNSKTLDLNTRIPQAYREKELQIRKQIADTLERGKIDLTLTIENTSDKNSTIINADIVKGYINQMLQIIPNADTTELLKMAVRMPDALVIPTEEIQEEEYKQIENIIEILSKQETDLNIENRQQFKINLSEIYLNLFYYVLY